MNDMPAGRSLHHFRLDRALAEGGMGVVYLGFDLALQRPVALKVIRPEYAKDPGFAARFIREARAQAQIVHPNVVQVFYVGQEGDTLFMVMELVEGGSLMGRLREHGPLDWRSAHRHFVALARGLHEAARLGIIHRDIKPDNVLLDRFQEAHLADFGLAAPVTSREAPTLPPMVGPSAALPNLTQVGAVMGSPAYMSPEQALGKPLDARSDIYALGATFLELLTGAPPTQAATLMELETFHRGPPPPPLTPRRGPVPASFARLIDRCLARDPAVRFQSYDELLEGLEATAPKPVIDAGGLPRALAWTIDVAVYVAALVSLGPLQLELVTRILIASAVWFLWLAGGAFSLRSTFGLWMMRLGLANPTGEELSSARVLARSVVQHLFVPIAGLTLAAVYNSWASATQLALVSVLSLSLLVSLVGTLARPFGGKRQTLIDRLFGTRVLVFVR